MTREEREKRLKIWGMIFGFPEVTLEDIRRIGLVAMDKEGNPTENRKAKGVKKILWLEDILPKKKRKFFFGKKKKKK